MGVQRAERKGLVAKEASVLEVRRLEVGVPREERLGEVAAAPALFEDELRGAAEEVLYIVLGEPFGRVDV